MSLTAWTKLISGGLTVAVIMLMAALAAHYRSHYLLALNEQRATAQLAASRLITITHMQRQQLTVAAIDAKYTRELADAKNTIADLQRDVASGTKRLRVNATCGRVPGTARAPGLADASTPRLTPDAERAYWRLREQLFTAEKQINGLQDYIRAIQNVEKTQ